MAEPEDNIAVRGTRQRNTRIQFSDILNRFT
jgi:hypothetical protein